MAESRDEVLEIAAQFIEGRSLLDSRGILAKRKRDREDAELRMKVREEMRDELAANVRSLKTNKNFDTRTILENIAALTGDDRHEYHLVDAWPLAWKGWVNIYCTFRCNSNSVPPESVFRVELTDDGRAKLAELSGNTVHS